VRGKALAHALAIALQGPILAVLTDAGTGAALGLTAAFTAVGAILAWAWARWPVPHALDMAIGMLSLGNLGMLLGWRIDRPAGDANCCCGCLTAGPDAWLARPWMWVGMLALANLAMLLLPRRPLVMTTACRAATFVGGNLGMVIGMAAGDWAASHAAHDVSATTTLVHFTGMTMGMVLGMLAGHALTLRLMTARPRGPDRPAGSTHLSCNPLCGKNL
jgi:hypothetical protein